MSPGTLPVVPPKKLTIALPSLALKQLTSVLVYVEVNSSGSDNIILSVAEQPRPSIMFKLYVPAERFEIEVAVCPFDHV